MVDLIYTFWPAVKKVHLVVITIITTSLAKSDKLFTGVTTPKSFIMSYMVW